MAAPRPPNFLLILVDEERRWSELPMNFQPYFEQQLPHRARLKRESVEYPNFRINTTPCSPARGSLYTGTHFQNHGVYSNRTANLSPKIATIGNLLQKVGYHCVYKGKWHLDETLLANLDDVPPQLQNKTLKRFKGDPSKADHSKLLEPWGFKEWHEGGDYAGSSQEGYLRDGMFAEEAAKWLEQHQGKVSDKPWLLAVNFINPHDIMFFNASERQKADRELRAKGSGKGAARESRGFKGPPEDPMYARKWQCAPTKRVDDLVGDLPPIVKNQDDTFVTHCGAMDDEDWEVAIDYYLNCIRDSDRHLGRVLDALDKHPEAEETVVIFLSDHGDMLGDFGLRQKGPYLNKGHINVPLFIRLHGIHPHVQKTACCHLDLAPTILAMAGIRDWRRRFPQLKGVDLSVTILKAPGASVQLGQRQDPDPDLDGATIFQSGAGTGNGRFFMQAVITDRYKFGRCFDERPQAWPNTWEKLIKNCDLILYNLVADPDERNNLAASALPAHKELIIKLNKRLDDLIKVEMVGHKQPWRLGHNGCLVHVSYKLGLCCGRLCGGGKGKGKGKGVAKGKGKG